MPSHPATKIIYKTLIKTINNDLYFKCSLICALYDAIFNVLNKLKIFCYKHYAIERRGLNCLRLKNGSSRWNTINGSRKRCLAQQTQGKMFPFNEKSTKPLTRLDLDLYFSLLRFFVFLIHSTTHLILCVLCICR